MITPELLKYIKEARRRGFDDYQIKDPLLKGGWLLKDVEEAFAQLNPKPKFKNKISIYLDSDLLELIEKRAKKNLLTLPEQIEDILRRSTLSFKKRKMLDGDKLDDLLVTIFSRRKRNMKK